MRLGSSKEAVLCHRAEIMIDAVLDEEILHSNSLATVTRHWLIVPDVTGRSRTILSLYRLSEVQPVKIKHPWLLAVSGGLFVLAAGALCSKQSSKAAGVLIGFMGAVSLIAYFVSRRAWVEFTVGSAVTRTRGGSHNEAEDLAAAVEGAQADLLRNAREESELAS